MNRLRAIAQSHLLPLLLGALVLRALIPVGFMPAAGAGFSLTAAMCNPAAGQPATSRSQTIEIPGTAPLVHCEYCIAPVAGPAQDFPLMGARPTADFDVAEIPPSTIYSRFALQRSQSPRGPPLA